MTSEMTQAIVAEIGMTEVVSQLGCVWERISNWGDKMEYKGVTRVSVNLDGSVVFQQFSRGPRGGFQAGSVGPAFSAQQWAEITAAVGKAQAILIGWGSKIQSFTDAQRSAMAMELPRGTQI